jgi:gamma-glutamyltranspeptidase/glutathione hydrolase
MYHFLEASKLAYADRNQYLADPDFVKQPVAGLLDQDYLKSQSQRVGKIPLVTPVTAGTPQGVDSILAPDAEQKPHGTTSLVIVDKDGNAISMTMTIESQFGSHLFTHGFFLNNELTDFSFKPKNDQNKLIANRVEAGKRPRSSITPVLVFDKKGNLIALSGSPGGNYIICYVAKNLILMLDMKMTPNQASAMPNLCALNDDPVIEAFPLLKKQLETLGKMGKVNIQSSLESGVTNIKRDVKGGWVGAADPRREGVAIGS